MNIVWLCQMVSCPSCVWFSLLSRGLWKFVWSISHVSPATVCVPLRPNDPAITTTTRCWLLTVTWPLGFVFVHFSPGRFFYSIFSNFYMLLCTILFALRVFLVARPSSVSAFCILGWLTLHPQRERERRQRTGGKNAMQCFSNCNAVVESSQVLSKFLYCLPHTHTHTSRRTCSITFLISTTTTSSNSIQLTAASEQKESHCRTKDAFKEMTTRYQNIITRAQPILDSPPIEIRETN